MAFKIFVKTLSLERDVVRQRDKVTMCFSTLVCVSYDLNDDYNIQPSKDNPSCKFIY